MGKCTSRHLFSYGGLPHIHFELYYDVTGKKKKTVQRAIIKDNRMNASAIKVSMYFQGEQFLRHHGRWIDSVWKSCSYAGALKENPINLTFSESLIVIEYNRIFEIF